MLGAAGLLAAAPAAARPGPQVRVDQLGYAPARGTRSRTCSRRARCADARFRGRGRRRARTVLRGRVGTSRGRWNRRYRAVQPARPQRAAHARPLPGAGRPRELAALPDRRPGRAPRARGSAESVAFFQAQRDGADVIPGPLAPPPGAPQRRARRRSTRPRPTTGPDSDVILGRSLQRDRRPRRRRGRLDRRRRLRQVHAHDRLRGRAAVRRPPRARRARRRRRSSRRRASGSHWLDKAWQDDGEHAPPGRHRLRQQGRHVQRRPRPVAAAGEGRRAHGRAPTATCATAPSFRANAPGDAAPAQPRRPRRGRVRARRAARRRDAARPRARAELATAARDLRRREDERRDSDVATALPHAFYPESSWRDDLELGAAELALAGAGARRPARRRLAAASAGWARAYLDHEAGDDTLNLYDTSALAHAELIRAAQPALGGRRRRARAARRPPHAARHAASQRAAQGPVRRRRGLRRLRRRLAHASASSPRPRSTSALTGDQALRRASRPRSATGRSAPTPWGASLMIGVGSRFPRCPQHVVANLAGGRDGTRRPARRRRQRPERRRAVLRRPRRVLRRGPRPARRQAATATQPFSGHGSRFVDDVRSWQTVEPAIDFTATAALAFALTG